jgi:hypothetical protein
LAAEKARRAWCNPPGVQRHYGSLKSVRDRQQVFEPLDQRSITVDASHQGFDVHLGGHNGYPTYICNHSEAGRADFDFVRWSSDFLSEYQLVIYIDHRSALHKHAVPDRSPVLAQISLACATWGLDMHSWQVSLHTHHPHAVT